jgi:hypothetical protein
MRTKQTMRNKATKANHRDRIAELRLKSVPVRKIATQLRISESTVARELAALAREWKTHAAQSIDTHRDRELRRLEIIEDAAWKEYERSRKDYSKEVTERIKAIKDGEILETPPEVVKRETGGRLGDPKYLQIALNAQEARRKMLGIDAPTKIAPTDPTGTKPYEKMDDAELDARVKELLGKAAA